MIKAVLLHNNNNRMYDVNALKLAVAEYNKLLARFGELNPNYCRESFDAIDLLRVSHQIHDVTCDDTGTVRGDIQVLNTPMGQILSITVDSNYSGHFAIRGRASIDGNGDCSSIKIAAFDYISN